MASSDNNGIADKMLCPFCGAEPIAEPGGYKCSLCSAYLAWSGAPRCPEHRDKIIPRKDCRECNEEMALGYHYDVWKKDGVKIFVKLQKDALRPKVGETTTASKPITASPSVGGAYVIGKNTNTGKDITITEDERVRHISVVGATGTGKSSLLKNIALQAVKNRESLIYIDVDNRSINDLLVRIPKERMKDVILLDFSDRRRFLGIHYTAGDRDIERAIELLKRLWKITPETPNLENTLRASLLTLQFNNLTLDRMPDLLRDKAFRASCMARIPHTIDASFVREFWEKDFNQHDVQSQIRNSDSTLNKIMQMFMDKYIAYIIAQTSNTLNLLTTAEESKV